MITKLYNIEQKTHKKFELKLKPIYKLSPKKNTNYSSSGKIQNENRSLHIRINQKSSIYNISKFAKEYKKSQEYKKILCQYPSFDFRTITSMNMKDFNKMKVQKNNNIFNETRFKPFMSFEGINNRNKNERVSINNKRNKYNGNYFYLYDDDRIERGKKRKIKEEERRRKEDEKMRKKAERKE